MMFVICADERISYVLIVLLRRKTADHWTRAAFHFRMTYFGPTPWLASDPDGADAPRRVSKAREHFSINGDFGRSQGRAAAPKCEIQTRRVGSAKLRDTAQKARLGRE